MLELQELRVSYGRVEVLHGVDLEVNQGEVVGIVGPNGAGKSSALRAICGLQKPSGGVINFDGDDLAGLVPEDVARRGIALVPEGRQIFATLSVEENLQLAARGKAAEISERMLRRFPILAERAGQRADCLSGGERQQLALARALVRDPKLLILDEPSLGLAPKMIDTIYELLGSLRDDGMTMLLVEQNVTRTIAFCERSVVLSGGKIRAEGRSEDLLRDRGVLRAYLGGQL